MSSGVQIVKMGRLEFSVNAEGFELCSLLSLFSSFAVSRGQSGPALANGTGHGQCCQEKPERCWAGRGLERGHQSETSALVSHFASPARLLQPPCICIQNFSFPAFLSRLFSVCFLGFCNTAFFFMFPPPGFFLIVVGGVEVV